MANRVPTHLSLDPARLALTATRLSALFGNLIAYQMVQACDRFRSGPEFFIVQTCRFGGVAGPGDRIEQNGSACAITRAVADEPVPLHAVQVRVVRPDEVPRFNALLREHHYLGFRKFCGRRLRHVAELGLSLRHLPRDWLAHHGHRILMALC